MQKLLYLFFLSSSVFSLAVQGQTLTCSKASTAQNQRTERVALSDNTLNALNNYDVHYYKVDLAVERDQSYVEGHTVILAEVIREPMNSFVFELSQNLTIDSLKINNELLSYTQTDTFVTVPLSSSLNTGTLAEVLVYYHGTPAAGLTTGTEPYANESLTWTLSEPYNAFHWFAVKQILTDKADSSEVWITTSDVNKAGSNGLLKETIPLPNNKVQYRWKSNYPIAYYLISLTVGKFTEYTIYANPAGAPQPIPIVNYIYDAPNLQNDWQAEMDKTANMIEVFSDRFGLYPFYKEKYGHCSAPIGGGMEHQTMTTQSAFITGLTAHELAHQWFGDQVTCSNWKDIWLNEGFASYCEYIYHQTSDQTEADNWLGYAYYIATTEPTGSVYVDDTASSARVFDSRLTYKKGGLLLHMLRHLINDDNLFFQGMKNYQNTFKNGTAAYTDFQSIMENTTGIDLQTFFNQWYLGSGYPILSAEWNHASDGNFYLEITQNGSDPSVTPLYEFPLECMLSRSGASDTLIHLNINQTNNYFSFPSVAGSVQSMTLDPDLWLLHTVDQVTNNTSLVVTENIPAHTNTVPLLFPNPALQQITIQYAGTTDKAFNVYNALGQKVYAGHVSKGETSFSLEGWSRGVYQIVWSDTFQSSSFIKE